MEQQSVTGVQVMVVLWVNHSTQNTGVHDPFWIYCRLIFPTLSISMTDNKEV